MIARADGLGAAVLTGALALAACGPDPAPGAAGAGTTTGTAAGAASAVGTTTGAASPTGAASAAGSGAPAAGAGSGAPAASPRCAEGRVLIAAGAFRMGSAEGDKDADADERPVREVTLQAYCLDRTEVTVASYAKCAAEAGGAGCTPASAIVVSHGLAPVDVLFWSKYCNAGQKDRDNHPVNCVDWKQAGAYCKWAGGRLPTEAEWEHAARGADGRKYPWGNEAPGPTRLNGCGSECAGNGPALGRKDKKTMFEGNDGAESTAPVGRYPEGASPSGALDLAGNVWEWTADAYAPYEASRTDGSAQAKGTGRVVRGGHWLNANPQSPRGANRESRGEEKRLEDVGFRCASEPLR